MDTILYLELEVIAAGFVAVVDMVVVVVVVIVVVVVVVTI